MSSGARNGAARSFTSLRVRSKNGGPWTMVSGAGRSLSSSTSAATSSSSPTAGESGLEFEKKTYPSFWTRLKQQKQGLGNMALSASIGFLALSIIKQEKELTHAKETAELLRRQNEALRETLEEALKSGPAERLATNGTDLSGERDVAQDLRGLTDESGSALGSSSRSKFMV